MLGISTDTEPEPKLLMGGVDAGDYHFLEEVFKKWPEKVYNYLVYMPAFASKIVFSGQFQC